MDSPTLDVAGVAAALAMSANMFIKLRARLIREHGFPRPLPGCGARWSALQVRAWIEAGGEPEALAAALAAAAAPPEREPSGPALLVARLAQKYGRAA